MFAIRIFSGSSSYETDASWKRIATPTFFGVGSISILFNAMVLGFPGGVLQHYFSLARPLN